MEDLPNGWKLIPAPDGEHVVARFGEILNKDGLLVQVDIGVLKNDGRGNEALVGTTLVFSAPTFCDIASLFQEEARKFIKVVGEP